MVVCRLTFLKSARGPAGVIRDSSFLVKNEGARLKLTLKTDELLIKLKKQTPKHSELFQAPNSSCRATNDLYHRGRPSLTMNAPSIPETIQAKSLGRAPKMHLVISNISKRPNVRALLETAAAFECSSVLVVGQKGFDFSPEGHDLPSALKDIIRSGDLSIQRFPSWEDCTMFLKEHGIRLVGVEIHKEARSIEAFLDGKDTAFLMGNEGTGLNAKQMNSCDAFVRISQHGGGTASLNVYVAASIVLHRFHQWQRTQRLGKQQCN